jgi:hypothetical protein
MLKLPVPLFQMDTPINFQPIEMCCSRRGNYVISSTDGTLHVLDPYGKLLGIYFPGKRELGIFMHCFGADDQ